VAPAAGILVAAGGWIALGHLGLPRALACGVLAAIGMTLAAAASTPPAAEFLVFAGVVVGLLGAALVSGTAVLIVLIALAILLVRARRGRALVGVDAVLAGAPLLFGALAAGHPSAGVVPWILASCLALVREAFTRARTAPARAVAIALALAFVPVSLVLPVRAGYGAGYFLTAMFAQLSVLVAAARLIVARTDRTDVLLKGAMVVGLIALVAGRVG
jgi:hypothetical protein